jgi:DNA cross-link repair 1B protein
MYLFQGFMGTILHTGDFRFTEEMTIESPKIFSSIIDELIFDNTYCNPMFNFPKANVVAK